MQGACGRLMTTIHVDSSKKYDVIIDGGLLSRCGEIIRDTCGGNIAVIVSDDNVFALYGMDLTSQLEQNGYDVKSFVIEHGEKSKNTENLVELLRFLAQNNVSRSDVICTLGGGVVGDFGALAAGMFNRGMPLAAIPTSLLAMVDSSVGGKTAVDLPEGKNLVGMFYQPDVVLCDYELLGTLPPEFFADGMAEVIKYGVISSESLFETLENSDGEDIRNLRDKDLVEKIIGECVAIKRDIVGEDELDKGIRQLLNFGHTIAHGIEQQSGYTIFHGNAVASGMVSISRAYAAMGKCEASVPERIEAVVKKYGLPSELPFEPAALSNAAIHDKKRMGRNITVVVPEKIGHGVLEKIPVEKMIEYIGVEK